MPELAAIGFVGAIIVFIAVNINLYWVHRSFQAKNLLLLQKNLFLVQKYWSVEKACLLETDSLISLEELRKNDYKMQTRSAFIFGTFLIFLSWMGLFILIIYLLSVHKFAKSRLEMKLFESELANKEFNNLIDVNNVLNPMLI